MTSKEDNALYVLQMKNWYAVDERKIMALMLVNPPPLSAAANRIYNHTGIISTEVNEGQLRGKAPVYPTFLGHY
jgi:hypothetical protein